MPFNNDICYPEILQLDDFIKEDTVVIDHTHSIFNLDDLSDSEELWIMDIPKSVSIFIAPIIFLIFYYQSDS